jgi:hypothetical protein
MMTAKKLQVVVVDNQLKAVPMTEEKLFMLLNARAVMH